MLASVILVYVLIVMIVVTGVVLLLGLRKIVFNVGMSNTIRILISMKLYKTTYKIYDNFGELIRISIDRPSDSSYDYVVVKEIIFDTALCEEALF